MILKEDFHRYPENRNEKSDPAPIVSGSRQIYLTFPAGSNFTEDDVSNYFKYARILKKKSAYFILFFKCL